MLPWPLNMPTGIHINSISCHHNTANNTDRKKQNKKKQTISDVSSHPITKRFLYIVFFFMYRFIIFRMFLWQQIAKSRLRIRKIPQRVYIFADFWAANNRSYNIFFKLVARLKINLSDNLLLISY